jgi:hypothetical protein
LRKSFIAAGAAALALGAAGIAHAQSPTSSVKVSLSPNKAGSKSKPKASTLKLTVTNTLTKQTAASLKITGPSQLTLTTKDFKKCSASKLENDGPSACPKGSQVGPKAIAHALANVNAATPPQVAFEVTPFATGSKTIGFYLKLQGGDITGLAVGKISGHGLTVSIPELPAQQYPKGVYNGLVDLTANLWVKSGDSVAKLTGCPSSKKLTFKNTIGFVPNPSAPASATSSATTTVACK